MKALITGSEGFVGKHLRRELEDHGYEVTGVDLFESDKTIKADLLQEAEVNRLMQTLRPDKVFHLAGQADVGKSWVIPARTIEINVIAAVHVMEAMRKYIPESSLLLVGSSDEYGILGNRGELVSEEMEALPVTPYAISKIAQEQMGKAYVRTYGMHICMTRSFNHGGAGQKPGFMIPDFADGIVQVEQGTRSEVLVGNLSTQRDFTHVKDVVRAYRLIAEKGKSGEIYNVGSGEANSAQEILNRLVAMARCPIPVRQDPSRMRPSDTPVIRCDRSKLTRETGWEPQYTLDDILKDTLAFYREQVGEKA